MAATMPQRIFAPTDLSDLASVGVAHAAALADAVGATLIVGTSIGEHERRAVDEFAAVEGLTIDDAVLLALRRSVADTGFEGELEVRTVFVDSPADGVLQIVADVHADSIVIASHGRSGPGRWLMGSVAEKIVRGADVPVTVVPVR